MVYLYDDVRNIIVDKVYELDHRKKFKEVLNSFTYFDFDYTVYKDYILCEYSYYDYPLNSEYVDEKNIYNKICKLCGTLCFVLQPYSCKNKKCKKKNININIHDMNKVPIPIKDIPFYFF